MQRYGHQTKENFSIWLLIPVFLASALIPLIVRMKSYETHLENYEWYTSSGTSSDFFLYHKAVFLLITAVIMIGVIVCRLYISGLSAFKSKYLIPVVVYMGLVILSFVFSQNKYFSARGMMDQFESGFVLLAYGLCVIYTFSVVESEKAVKAVIYGLLASACVMSIVGVSQYLKMDLFSTDLVKYLYLPKSFWPNKDSIQFTMAPGQVYLSLYNPNYVGSYVVMVAPLFLMAIFVTKNKIIKALFAAVEVGLAICLIGSRSKTGLVMLIFIFLVMIIAYRKLVLQYKKFAIPGIFVFLLLFFVYDFAHDFALVQRFQSIMVNVSEVRSFSIEDIRTEQEAVEIDYAGNTLKASYTLQENKSMVFELKDQEDKEVEFALTEDGSKVKVNDDRFPFSLIPTQVSDTQYCMGIEIPKYIEQAGVEGAETNIWYFTNDAPNMSGYAYYTPYGKFVKMQAAEHMFFENKGGFADGRGYIWSRTFPLLKKYWLFGSGPDTFLLVFPQTDYVQAYNDGYRAMLISKPHNIFLQIAVQTGIPSLIAYLVFFLYYFIGSVRLYWKDRFESYLSVVGVAICLGNLGYILTGLMNDSSTTLAPIYWTMMGLGIAVNALVQKQRKEQEDLTESATAKEKETDAARSQKKSVSKG